MTDTNSTLLVREPFTQHRAFTLWRLDPHPTNPHGKPIKVPVHYDGVTRHDLGNDGRNGKPVRPPNPAPPLTAQEATQWLAHHHATRPGSATPGQVGYLGAGFRPEGTGLVCIDLDGCLTAAGWSAGAVALMARFPGALVEQSISGTGAHVWVTVRGAGPGRRGKQTTPLGDVEVYGAGQFIALGTVLAGDAHVDHTEAVDRLVAEFWPAVTVRTGPASEWTDKTPDQQAAAIADLRSALAVLDADNRDEWVAVGQALQALGEEGYALWAEWSATSSRYPGGEGLDKWDTFSGERTGYGAVLARAEATGKWTNPARRGDPLLTFGAAALPVGALIERPAGREVAPAAAGEDLSFMAASGGLIAATVASIETALMSTESGVQIAYDTFKDRISIATRGADWRPFRDTDYGRLRAAFERRGFKPVPHEAMKTTVAMVAETHQFDSAQMWGAGLVWDGVPRIDTAMIRYYGCADTPYHRAVGAYMFTTLGGRCMVPGVKADMAIIMVGLQGARKTSSLEALVPEPDAFGEVDLSKDDDVIARKLRGKMVIELAEMRGFHGRDADANKAWISRRREEWTPKYQEFNTTFWRRCLIIGTANDVEQLDDPTGARRFLPVEVGAVNIDALRADCAQLWAEGIARFTAKGSVEWEAAEHLAKAEHHKFEVVDELASLVHNFLESAPPPKIGEQVVTTPRSAHPIRGVDILYGALGMAYAQIKKTDQMNLSKIMKKLGYVRATTRVDGVPTKVWTKR